SVCRCTELNRESTHALVLRERGVYPCSLYTTPTPHKSEDLSWLLNARLTKAALQLKSVKHWKNRTNKAKPLSSAFLRRKILYPVFLREPLPATCDFTTPTCGRPSWRICSSSRISATPATRRCAFSTPRPSRTAGNPG